MGPSRVSRTGGRSAPSTPRRDATVLAAAEVGVSFPDCLLCLLIVYRCTRLHPPLTPPWQHSLTDVAPHVLGCRSTLSTRVHDALRDVARKFLRGPRRRRATSRTRCVASRTPRRGGLYGSCPFSSRWLMTGRCVLIGSRSAARPATATFNSCNQSLNTSKSRKFSVHGNECMTLACPGVPFPAHCQPWSPWVPLKLSHLNTSKLRKSTFRTNKCTTLAHLTRRPFHATHFQLNYQP